MTSRAPEAGSQRRARSAGGRLPPSPRCLAALPGALPHDRPEGRHARAGAVLLGTTARCRAWLSRRIRSWDPARSSRQSRAGARRSRQGTGTPRARPRTRSGIHRLRTLRSPGWTRPAKCPANRSASSRISNPARPAGGDGRCLGGGDRTLRRPVDARPARGHQTRRFGAPPTPRTGRPVPAGIIAGQRSARTVLPARQGRRAGYESRWRQVEVGDGGTVSERGACARAGSRSSGRTWQPRCSGEPAPGAGGQAQAGPLPRGRTRSWGTCPGAPDKLLVRGVPGLSTCSCPRLPGKHVPGITRPVPTPCRCSGTGPGIVACRRGPRAGAAAARPRARRSRT